MTPYEKNQRRLNWKLGLIVVIVSLIMHQLLFLALYKAGLFDTPKEEKQMKVSLLEAPKPPARKEKKKEESVKTQ
ncbi:MAG: hypothetical protein JXX14_17455, partial [Deltaproteobacteria bacterium]|nr:hypothetical protein [Deltaproteobacteria bacterium]